MAYRRFRFEPAQPIEPEFRREILVAITAIAACYVILLGIMWSYSQRLDRLSHILALTIATVMSWLGVNVYGRFRYQKRWKVAVTEAYPQRAAEIRALRWVILGASLENDVWTIDYIRDGEATQTMQVPAKHLRHRVSERVHQCLLSFPNSRLGELNRSWHGAYAEVVDDIQVILPPDSELPPRRPGYFPPLPAYEADEQPHT